MKNWFTFTNKAKEVVDVSIHDEIGMWGVSAKDFMSALNEHKDASVINLSLHSPGGNLIDGLAIYNTLAYHPAKVYSQVAGIAASAASLILMAGDVISMPEDSFIMIHNAQGGAMGDSEELRKTADVMDQLQDSAVNIYMKRSGKDEGEIREMMNAETWMNAADALDAGFIDTITDKIGVAAKSNAFEKYFKSMPFNKEFDFESIKNIRDFDKYLRDAGISRKATNALVARAKDIFQVEPENDDHEIMLRISEALDKVQIPEHLAMT